MLITTSVITKWNSKTKLYYTNLGYEYTKMGDSFSVSVEDLPKRSIAIVEVECDYCHTISSTTFLTRTIKLENSTIKKDCCRACYKFKIKETLIEKYGVDNVMLISKFKKAQSKAVFEKHGVTNVFKSEAIKSKIRKTNIDKYGKENFTQTKAYIDKTRATNMERYGETSHMKTEFYREMFRGEKSPVWKGGIHDERWDRLQPVYKAWRMSVFSRDSFCCRRCYKKARWIEAHHISNWKTDLEARYETDNGITFCKKCHSVFHSLYGKKYNNLEQVLQFIER